jgi:NitT/TauT family transport system ATP-binding protein
MTEPILSASNITHSFRTSDGGNVLAVNNVSLAVAPNTFTCLIGPSGSGKTTLLRILAGLIRPKQGQVTVKGTPLRGPRRSMSVVAQKENLMPWRSVLDNVLLPLQLAGVNRAERVERARHMLEVTGLADFENVFPAELSGGMAQRVSIARGIVTEPDILLLDEPFGALDAITREQMWHELLRLWGRTQAAVLMVTHDIREAVFLADRVVVLSTRPGRIIGDIDVTFDRPRKMSLLTDGEFVALEARVRDCIRF